MKIKKIYVIDEEICQKIDELATKFKKSKSHIVQEALRLYSDPAVVEKIEEIDKGIADIKTKIFMKYMEQLEVGYYDF